MKTDKIINGYKAFRNDMSNNYGMKFEEGKSYHIDGDIQFGVKGNGFHLCENIEDTFRYINDDNPIIAKVTAFGEIVESFDNYNGYYDMYSASDITIDHIMSREEVINEILKKSEMSACRFIITGYKLTDIEVKLFEERYKESKTFRKFIDYYVYNDEHAFEREEYSTLKKGRK